MLTAEGAQMLWSIAAGLSDDSLAGGTASVSDGTARADTAIDSADVSDRTLTLTATFGEQDANFEWAILEIVSANGVVVDREVKDSGRKAAGAVWTLETVLELAT